MFIVFCLCSIDTLARVLSPVFVSRFRRIKQANRSESEDGTHIVLLCLLGTCNVRLADAVPVVRVSR